MATLSYSVTEPALRSPVEEWQPHAKQSESTHEWWYLTAVAHDAAGNPYFLAWCPFHFTGEKTVPMSAGLPRDQRAIAALTGFTDYRDSFHIGGFPAAVVDEADTWEPTTNALRFVAGDYSSEWSYNGDTMHLTVASPQLSYDLRLTGAGHVMYVKDKLGIKGFIQSLDFRALRSLSVWRPRGPWLATELGSAGPTGFTISVTQRTLRNLGKSGFQRQNQSLITSRCYSEALVLLRRRG